jgi:ATP-dependent Zn protease
MWRKTLVYVLILLALVAILVAFFRPSTESSPLEDLSTFLRDTREGRVQRIVVSGDTLKVTVKGGQVYHTRKEPEQSVLEVLRLGGVEDPTSIDIAVQAPSQFGDWLGLIIQFLPILIFIGLIMFMMRQARAPQSPRGRDEEIRGLRERQSRDVSPSDQWR